MESGEQRRPYGKSPVLYPVWVAMSLEVLGVAAVFLGSVRVALVFFRAAGAALLFVPLFCGFLWDDPRTSKYERLAAKMLAIAVLMLYLAVVLVEHLQGKPGSRADASFLGQFVAAALLFVIGRVAGRWRRTRALNRE
ncbi:MAG: hypothetical protein A2Z18_04535 [Armatimonadetes bacterium RBG_16_58_9]|nr:MAG: hypothetical protein A2Z18_04535 [Armatimonadetes bacterium RBG_16_58_9]